MPEYTTPDLIVTVKFNSTKESDKGTPAEGTAYAYHAQVTYKTLADMAEKAGRFTTWALQRRARKGELPTGKLILVNGEGEYAKSFEEEIADEDDFAKLERMKAAIEAKIAARNAKPVEMSPEEEAVLEELTKPEVEKAPVKGKGKRQV